MGQGKSSALPAELFLFRRLSQRRAGCACWLLLLLIGCDRFPDQATISLAQAFPRARREFIVCPSEPAGGLGFRAHLGTGLRPELDGVRAFSDSDGKLEALRFFLYEARPIRIEINARAGEQKTVKFSLGQREMDLPLGEKIVLNLDAGDVSGGLNILSVAQAKDVTWQSFKVFPRDAADSLIAGHPLLPHLSGDERAILIPFGQTLDFPLESVEMSALDLQIAPWLEEGAPAFDPAKVKLRIALRRDGQPLHQQSVLGCGPHQVRLPDQLGRFSLQLGPELTQAERLLPGQLGIRLTQSNLRRSSVATAEQSPTPENAPIPPRNARPPNVVLYIVDTLRTDRLSLYDYRFETSPSLSRLAAEAITFDQVTAQSSWTKPTVASILTGLEPSQHGVVDFADILNPSLTTWAEMLEAENYQTFGVVSNGLVGGKFGFEQGFERYETVPVETTARELGAQAQRWLKQRDSARPFFLYLHALDPHLPYTPPPPWRSRAEAWHNVKEKLPEKHPRLGSWGREGFKKLTDHLFDQAVSGLPPDLPADTVSYVQSLYDGEVAFTDAAFGELLDWLKSEGLYDNTIIVFTADHGEELLDRGWLGHTHSLHEELVRVPLVIKLPQGRQGGKRVAEVYQQVDILATVLRELALSPTSKLDGVSYPRPTPKAAFIEVDVGADAKEMGQAISDYQERGYGIREERWKLFHHLASIKPTELRALYDLTDDPLERKNLILDYPVKALFLEAELAARRDRPSPFKATKISTGEARDELRSLDYLH